VIRLSQLIGQRVLTRGHGTLLGSIKRVLLDPERSAIDVAQLERPEGGDVIVGWADVVGVADAAVTVHDGNITRPVEGPREEGLVAGQLELFGKSVLNDRGDSLGELEDLELDEVSGRVVRLHAGGQAVRVDRFVSLGPDAIIIATTRATSRAASAR
jgi:sporulation protein YlmC with PRC-barrel domain